MPRLLAVARVKPEAPLILVLHHEAAQLPITGAGKEPGHVASAGHRDNGTTTGELTT